VTNSGRGRPSQSLLILGGVLAIVIVAAGLAWMLGGGPGAGTALAPTASPASAAPTPVFSDLPLVTVPPRATPSAAPGTTAGTSPGLTTAPPETAAPTRTPAATGQVGIRAKRIRIARLDIDLAIIEGDGIDAPIGKAAHFPGSAWPGDGSNIYIYGHAQTGMFINLWKARTGDKVVLDLVDGTSRTYVVTRVLPKVPWDALQYLDPTPAEQLTLQTSTSYYPTAPRFVVIAVPAT
jgi:LPXTG-site transpeptidase (sortase) family protein